MYEYYKGEFKELGFDVDSKGFVLFADLLQDVRGLFAEGKTEEEIRELLPRYYLEQYHFVQEIGKFTYFAELTAFCESSTKSKRINKDKKVNGVLPKMGLDDYVIFFAKKFNSKNNENKDVRLYVYNSKFGKIKNV